jgi:hypothetical protein
MKKIKDDRFINPTNWLVQPITGLISFQSQLFIFNNAFWFKPDADLGKNPMALFIFNNAFWFKPDADLGKNPMALFILLLW